MPHHPILNELGMTSDRFIFLRRNFDVRTPISSDYDVDMTDGNSDNENESNLAEHLVEAKIKPICIE